jgi:hypothetical protein
VAQLELEVGDGIGKRIGSRARDKNRAVRRARFARILDAWRGSPTTTVTGMGVAAAQ